MLRNIQGGTHGQEEDTDDEQPSASSSGTHQPQLASRSVDSATVPSTDQPPSTSSLGTDTLQRTTTSESTSPVTQSPSAGDNVEICVLLVVSYMFGNKKLNWQKQTFFSQGGIIKELCLGHQNG